MTPEEIKQLAVDALEDLRAVDLRVIDVRGSSSITDFMVIATGTSNRHVKSLSENVVKKAKASDEPPLGVEGGDSSQVEWVLVDLNDVVVHVMLPQIRDFYNLEKLWSMDEADQQEVVRELEARASRRKTH